MFFWQEATGIDSQSGGDPVKWVWATLFFILVCNRDSKMRLVYRPMKKAVDNLPLCGSNSKELGVRVPPSEFADIDMSDSAMVVINGRGMSVGRHWTTLPAHLIPKRLASPSIGATGSNTLACFRFGTGEFIEGELTDDLRLVLKPGQADRGNIAPGREMNIGEFQKALAATRDRWEIDEVIP